MRNLTPHPSARLARARRLIAASFITLVAAATVAAVPASANIDADCTRTNVYFNDHFYTPWSDGDLLFVPIGWRMMGRLSVYDRCDHGGIQGTVGVYEGNILANSASYDWTLKYATESRNTWTHDWLVNQGEYTSGGWHYWSINVDNNIGLTDRTRIKWLKMASWINRDGRSGASRNERCYVPTRNCDGYLTTGD